MHRLIWPAVICLATAGCGIITHTKPGEYRTAEEAALVGIAESGQATPLRTITDFDWDEVHLFLEYATSERVEEIVGSDVIDGSVGTGGLLVFEQDGQVVRKVSIDGDFLRADQPSWDSSVVLQPYGDGFVRLTEPN